MNIAHVSREVFEESIKQLVDIDRNWVLRITYRKSLCNLRPFIFASDEFLGVRVARNYRYMVITSPFWQLLRRGNQNSHPADKPIRSTSGP